MNGTLGGRIAELLTQLNMTQRELAEKVDVTEVSMSRYIKGDRVPKGPVIANIATALHTTTDYLLNGNSSESGDFESEYYMIHRLIAKNVSKMTSKQKRELINALLESEDE
ncbi:MAG: helix-turn-helix domain-containing protein [Butyrivibrio sp.]|jgi:transcriptional regulator with XRE-family HTH domain|uniref:Transcriptional regulator, contains XRE-family HTH domain n=1 Tax=Butyrivibrio hungatei TaxID=185008 RepID=A0A1G5AGL0_9FIRM|nr:helix-turn-helix transcriptional regulator [Butyrivibrio hungatei]MBQ4220886.1 helix-turn-helix transcriptional regulator [Butyrivibrio sp.]MBR4358964.1 helix-turn-helix transcriptional regulator [Butyrivibrio sp.]MCR4996490.1 helix-turn-helix domain-containing protein [Butyrivibrio sp.]MEE3470826.1 helix-turn-helix transcriptional regulator [Butyrivibrio hungatei]SCX77023.1 Transcriptional regulator, contains XRE-family HTH domain [Butyrivibrio hungatei]